MNTVRILHVDDEPDIREIVEMSLGLNAEFQLRSAASGPEALATAAEWLPSLILLDVMMPRMDGPTTLTHLREAIRANPTYARNARTDPDFDSIRREPGTIAAAWASQVGNQKLFTSRFI